MCLYPPLLYEAKAIPLLLGQVTVDFTGNPSSQEINGTFSAVSCESVFSAASASTLGIGTTCQFSSSSSIKVPSRNVASEIAIVHCVDTHGRCRGGFCLEWSSGSLPYEDSPFSRKMVLHPLVTRAALPTLTRSRFSTLMLVLL